MENYLTQRRRGLAEFFSVKPAFIIIVSASPLRLCVRFIGGLRIFEWLKQKWQSLRQTIRSGFKMKH